MGWRTLLPPVILFGILNILDFLLTRSLILEGHGMVVEANPIARQILQFHGWSGLAVFKAGSIALAVFSMALVSCHTRKKSLMGFCNLALAMTACYSAGMIAWLHAGSGQKELGYLVASSGVSRKLDDMIESQQEFIRKHEEIVRLVRKGRMNLPDGASAILDLRTPMIPEWLAKIQGGSTCLWPEIELAKTMLDVDFRDEPDQIQTRLLDEFKEGFGIDYNELKRGYRREEQPKNPDEPKFFPFIQAKKSHQPQLEEMQFRLTSFARAGIRSRP